jgi:hypothetical protein
LIVTLVGAGAGAVVRGGVGGVPARDVGAAECVAVVAVAVAAWVRAVAGDGFACAVVAELRDGDGCAARRAAGAGVVAEEVLPVETTPAGTTPAAASGAG